MSDHDLLDERALSKLRWRCRRGLLENDLFIERFFDVHGSSITVRQARAMNALMDLSDNDLLDLLLRRKEPEAISPARKSSNCWVSCAPGNNHPSHIYSQFSPLGEAMKLVDNKATLSFSNGAPSVELPVYAGNIGPDVIDIRKLYGQTGNHRLPIERLRLPRTHRG